MKEVMTAEMRVVEKVNQWVAMLGLRKAVWWE